jgi:branched-chain amino acid transport system permease protein
LTRALTAALLLLLAALAPAAAADPTEAVRRCLELQPVFVKAPGGITVSRQDDGPLRPFAVRVDWRASADEPAGFYICFFLPRTQTGDSWQIAQVQSSRFGVLSRYDVQQAYKMLRAMAYPPTPPAAPAGPLVRLLHALQLAIDALGLGAVYALLAIPFTLVFGITRVLNLAFGEVHTTGAYLFAIGWAGGLATAPLPLTLLATAALVLGTGAALGHVTWHLALARPAGRHPGAAIVAALGLGIVLAEILRLAQGARTRYLLVDRENGWPVIQGLGFDVWLSRGHLGLLALVPPVALALWWLLARTRTGLALRACAQDPATAALLGVDVGRMIALAFALGSALAAFSGLVIAVQYGVLTPAMGWTAALKALTAAVLGGIGSVPGAVLGAFLLAALEVALTALSGGAWRDVWVFALLVLVLTVRPQGLLGGTGRDAQGPV